MKKERLKFLFQGILLLILGMLFMSNPVRQGVIFLTVIGVTFALIGIVTVIDGIFMTKEMKYKILRVFEGLLISAIGIVFFLRNPARGAFLVVSLVVIMLMILAVTNTLAIFKSDNNLKWVAIVLNILVVWFGILSLFDPQLAVAIFYWTVSFQLIFTGVNNVMMYFLIPNIENLE
ncbi:DUF308 domain-containing protein [Alkalibacterium sp. f15]|uniref:DUF308 domain-containing protein n=1 Tax=Alkalibacterium sp. f15 TaxID=3414029 RepID=UPI003BF7CB16